MTARRVGDLDGQPVWLCKSAADGTGIEPTPKSYFTCGFFLFNSKWNTDDMRSLVAYLIEAGCVSMMFHGERCREAEDLADNVFVEGGYEANFGGNDTLMTTSADGKTVLNAVFDLFCASFPTSGFKNSSFYVIASGSDDESDDLARSLAEPHQTIRAALDTMPRR